MHKYMRAIGFSDFRRKDIQILIDEVVEKPDRMKVTLDSDGNELVEFVQEIAPGIGVAVRGYYDEEDEFEAEYYVPYINGYEQTSKALVDIEKRTVNESYTGLFEDPRVEMSIIFQVNEVAAMLEDYRDLLQDGPVPGVCLSALSTSGMVLLPVRRSEREERFAKKALGIDYQSEDLEKTLRDEYQMASTEQTRNEMNAYALLQQRLKREDVMSVVATTFMPYGMECDQYAIIGVILKVQEVENLITEEKLYVLKVDVNGLIFDLCINQKDLEGIPEEGRRFKGQIWLMGTIMPISTYEYKRKGLSH